MFNEIFTSDLIEYVISVESNEDKQEDLYNQYEKYIIEKAEEIRKPLRYKNGVYYPTAELFEGIEYKTEFKHFILDHLKTLNIEFYKNDLYRVV